MKKAGKLIVYAAIIVLAISCNDKPEPIGEMETAPKAEVEIGNAEELSEKLKKEGYQTFTYKEGDSTYLMQQYYLVLLKKGKNRNQDSLQAAKLQEQHMAHLNRMYQEGYSSLAGPMGDDGEIRGIVVYNTRNLKEADSLANLDPMVKAGRLEVEIYPWWAAKGGKLN